MTASTRTILATARAGGLALLLALLALPGVAHATEVQRVTSPGGIVAWLVSDETVPIIAMDFAFRGGAAQDPPGKAGVASLAASLLDEGAGDLGEEAFKRRLEETAVRMSFSAGRDTLEGSLATLADRRDEAFELLSLALASPRFDPEPLTRVQNQMITARRAQSTDPDTIASRLFNEAVFPAHPYGNPVQGTVESLAAIERDDVAGFHRDTIARDNLVVGVVGAITAEDLGPLLDVAFGGLPESATLQEIPDITPRLGQTLSAVAEEPQTIIRMAAPGLKRADPDFIPAFVMNHILGGGTFSSWLYEEIREQRGLAYSVGSSLIPLRHSALMLASTSTRPDTADEVAGLMRAAIERMATEGPTETELVDAKRYLTGNYALRFDTSSKIAGQLVGLQLESLPIDYFDNRNALIEAVTLEDVRRAAARILSGPITELRVGPGTGG